jgi:hypothetical protein
MMERIGETSPRFEARITGAGYLLTILTGIFAQVFGSGSLAVDGHTASTATNILPYTLDSMLRVRKRLGAQQ